MSLLIELYSIPAVVFYQVKPLSAVLFLCTGNSARSQLAEALFRHIAGDRFETYSAGTQPQTIDPRVFQVLDEQGIDAAGLQSKTVETLSVYPFDYVITLCDNAKDECARYPDSSALMHWNLPDPRPQEGIEPFRQTFAKLEEFIHLFLKLNAPDDVAFPDSPSTFFKILSDNTRLRILMLIEDEKELCVSELSGALNEIQPKISRHLAQMRAMRILSVRRQGQSAYYHLSGDLPAWINMVLATVRQGNPDFINNEKIRLKAMLNRPK